jgi:hypothetical protein
MSLSELIGGGGEFSRSTERVRKELVDAAPESPVIGRTTIGTNMPNIAERIRPNNSESITEAKVNETSGEPAQLNDSYRSAHHKPSSVEKKTPNNLESHTHSGNCHGANSVSLTQNRKSTEPDHGRSRGDPLVPAKLYIRCQTPSERRRQHHDDEVDGRVQCDRNDA